MVKLFIVPMLLGAAALAAPSDPTYRDVENLVREKNITRIEDLLKELPEYYRSSHVVVYESESMQGASPLLPRVILYGHDARLLMAFNGDPKQAGYHALEVIEFNDAKARFEFHEIEFPEERAGRAKFSQTNPAKCLTCHQQDPRPNWEAYPFWPGVYGSESHPFQPHDPDYEMPGTEEGKNWREFLKGNAKQGRYQYVLNLDKKLDSRLAYKYSADKEPGAAPYEHYRDFAPTTQLTQLIFELNGRRIARALREWSEYPRYRYALFGALVGCGKAEDLVPEHERGHWKRSYDSFHEEIRKSLDASTNSFENGRLAQELSTLSTILQGSGIEVKSFSANFRRTPWGFVAPATPEALGAAAPLLATDPWLKLVGKKGDYGWYGRCAVITKLSHWALSKRPSVR